EKRRIRDQVLEMYISGDVSFTEAAQFIPTEELK
ncbi:plasmid transfer ATPase TraJ, partial [Salmonella enterica]|nr:plasmid transfer ATPase TraJ [Salmonella enterica]EJF6007941.1 plasmid transfer ATPase TraJ [Salmonella enterica]EJF6165303.1 plasmid transfer ATPase TraJ [Salmonella enterica]